MTQTVKSVPAMQENRVGSLGGKIPWRRAWQRTPVFLPGESHGHRNLVGYSLWGHKELDTAERLTHTFSSAQSCLTLCNPVGCSTPGLPVRHQPLKFTQTHVH